LVKRVTRVGNSAGLTFDQPVLRQVGWEVGTEVEIRVEGDQIILSRHRYATDKEASASSAKVFARRRKLMERLAR
jgi:antitoxin component of MazEF toxin-antitoxin module